jgi:hypothetical protein
MSRVGAGGRLARALCAAFEGFNVTARCEMLANRSWTSITFSGERHAVRLTIEGVEANTAADAFLAGLEETEFPLPGHYLVDIGAVSDERDPDARRVLLGLEALTVEAG